MLQDSNDLGVNWTLRTFHMKNYESIHMNQCYVNEPNDGMVQLSYISKLKSNISNNKNKFNI